MDWQSFLGTTAVVLGDQRAVLGAALGNNNLHGPVVLTNHLHVVLIGGGVVMVAVLYNR